MPYGSNGIDDLFYYDPFSFEKWDAMCQKKYGTEPRINWEAVNWGTYDNIAH